MTRGGLQTRGVAGGWQGYAGAAGPCLRLPFWCFRATEAGMTARQRRVGVTSALLCRTQTEVVLVLVLVLSAEIMRRVSN